MWMCRAPTSPTPTATEVHDQPPCGAADTVPRIDVELVARGLAPSRSAAQRLIADGAVWFGPGARVTRPSQQVGQADALWVTESDETRYVSRGGAKLAHALQAAGINPAGEVALDLGMSTGGFADCLLQAGAARVIGIEVGHGQLHPRLAADPRVSCLERTHLLDVTLDGLVAHIADTPAAGFALAVADLSFISLARVLPCIDTLLAEQATVLLLVKPQFEVGPGGLDRRGIVRDPEAAEAALARIGAACQALGWSVIGTHPSALVGGDGNQETFIHARVGTRPAPLIETAP